MVATSCIYPVGSVTDPFADCEDCIITESTAYDTGTILDPYSDCDVDLESACCSYYYVTFPFSTYVTNLWTATTARALNYIIAPTTDNGYYYKASVEGTTGATEPTWPTLFGETVVDGTVTWECYGYRTMTGSYMTANTTPDISQYVGKAGKMFGQYILTLSDQHVLECWSGGIPNLYGKVSETENITLVWRQHPRTFAGLVFDEYLGIIIPPDNDYIFLDTEDGSNGDGINWLDTQGNFIKYSRLRTSAQIGERLQVNRNICTSNDVTSIVIKTMSRSDNVLNTVTFTYDSPGVYNPTNNDTITYAGISASTLAYNFLYSSTEATVELSGDTIHSLVTLNADGTITSLDRVNASIWTSALHGGYNIGRVGCSIIKVYNDYLLVGPVYNQRWQFLLCEPNTINPIKY